MRPHTSHSSPLTRLLQTSKLYYQNKFCQSLQITWNQAFRQSIERQKVRNCVFHRNFLKYTHYQRSKLYWNWLIFMAERPGLELPYGEHWSVFSRMVCLQHCCGNHLWTVSERISVKPNEKKCWIGSSHIGSNLISFPDLLWTKPKARSVKVRKFVFLDWLLHLTPAQSPLWKLTRQTFFKLKF